LGELLCLFWLHKKRNHRRSLVGRVENLKEGPAPTKTVFAALAGCARARRLRGLALKSVLRPVVSILSKADSNSDDGGHKKPHLSAE
jgi:hypothetical protein